MNTLLLPGRAHLYHESLLTKEQAHNVLLAMGICCGLPGKHEALYFPIHQDADSYDRFLRIRSTAIKSPERKPLWQFLSVRNREDFELADKALAASCTRYQAYQNGKVRVAIMNYLGHLNQTVKQDDQEDYSYWDVADHPSLPRSDEFRNDCGTCTVSADLVARQFGGRVLGWAEGANKNCSMVLEDDVRGHDFAVVGPYLVDWWARYFREITDTAIFELEDPKVLQLYGPKENWELVKDYRK